MSVVRISRREAIAAGLAAPVVARAAGSAQSPRIVVVGAGVFGGWTALYLLRSGAAVTLVDAWGPGNSRASSGGETRLIRASYGEQRIYTRMVLRALDLWRENEIRFGTQLFFPVGLLRIGPEGNTRIRQVVSVLREMGVPVEDFGRDELERRYPQVNPEGIGACAFEPEAGYLLARRGCQEVLDAFLAEGGEYRQAEVMPGAVSGGRMSAVRLSDGGMIEADRYVFACGPWLAGLFPGFDPPLVRPSRQEIYYFGPPPGRADLTDRMLPTWIASGSGYYGAPGNTFRGFKLADDRRGGPFDPTHGERTPSPDGIAKAREFMEMRFPGMRGAPLVEARVCQYEQSADGNLIVDTHPEARNAWIVGGGSGHGYKFGPALGEMVAEQVLGQREKEPFFGLARFG